jgi:hypothetical protein
VIVTFTAQRFDYGNKTGVQIETSEGYRSAMRVPPENAATEGDAISYAAPFLLAAAGIAA